jgi:ssDNA thymidine ADP-ribosyltransferase, DarT
MKRSEVRDLQYIVAVTNVPSILSKGLLSHNLAAPLGPRSIARPGVQKIRAKIVVPGGLRLHDYVNLFFDAHNLMLSDVQKMRDEICVLEISSDVLDLPEVMVTDRNAAVRGVVFRPPREGVAALKSVLVYNRRWNQPIWTDSDEERELRRNAKGVEVLVPNSVPPKLLTGRAIVWDETVAKTLLATCPSLRIRVSPNFFFAF